MPQTVRMNTLKYEVSESFFCDLIGSLTSLSKNGFYIHKLFPSGNVPLFFFFFFQIVLFPNRIWSLKMTGELSSLW